MNWSHPTIREAATWLPVSRPWAVFLDFSVIQQITILATSWKSSWNKYPRNFYDGRKSQDCSWKKHQLMAFLSAKYSRLPKTISFDTHSHKAPRQLWRQDSGSDGNTPKQSSNNGTSSSEGDVSNKLWLKANQVTPDRNILISRKNCEVYFD